MPEKTIEQIDAELEKEFFPEGDDTLEVVDEDELDQIEDSAEAEEVEESEDNTEEVEEENVQENVQEEEPKPKEDKQEYAWKELRTKKQELEKTLQEKEANLSKFERMAKELGYNSAEELLKRFDEEETEKEAKNKGVDPAFYKEFKTMQTELNQTKAQREQELRNERIRNFVSDFDSLISENGLTEKDKQQIVQELEQDGYTVDDIIAIKSPKKLLTGYMVDKIAEKKVQSKLKTKKKEFVDEKHVGVEDVTADDLEKQIADEMKSYAKAQGYKL